jgi:hypothetical protein
LQLFKTSKIKKSVNVVFILLIFLLYNLQIFDVITQRDLELEKSAKLLGKSLKGLVGRFLFMKNP